MKKILILQAHPNKESLVSALADNYKQGAKKSGNEVELIHLADLEFDPNLWVGYKEDQPLEGDLVKVQEKIKAADHLVFAYPTWWGTMPALLKGFIDRVMLPGFAFKYTSTFPEKLLKGKSGRILTTMDSPWIWYNLFMGAPGHKAMKRTILKFCGVTPVKNSTFYSVRGSSPEKRAKWLEQMQRLGGS